MADLPAPVAFDLVTALLDVSEAPAGVALLLLATVAVPGHVTSLSTAVAQMFSLPLRLLAVFRDVTPSATVVTGILSLLTVSGDVSEVPAAVTEQIFSSTATFPSTSAGTGTVLRPVATAAAPEALVTAHHHDN